MDTEYEITEYSLLTAAKNPSLFFKNIKNYLDFRIVSNLLGLEDSVTKAIGYSDISEFLRK
ncbi:hypothetical protein [Oxyplasma meridianum]|uniref:hypothetical protein n=1 Tax=Oxyplasma meridianum TaxID=3073602 RepID=UPI00372D0147